MDKDQLRALFDMQKALNQRIGVETESMDEAQKTQWVLNYARAMGQELAELTDSVPWKWWAKYQTFDELEDNQKSAGCISMMRRNSNSYHIDDEKNSNSTKRLSSGKVSP